jgi:hypothetical protein
MGNTVQSLCPAQQVSLASRGSVQGALDFGEFRGHLWSSHPESIPEAFAWLQRKAGSGCDCTLRCVCKQAEGDLAATRPLQQPANRFRPLGVGTRRLLRPLEKRTESPAAKNQAEEDGDQQPEERGSP